MEAVSNRQVGGGEVGVGGGRGCMGDWGEKDVGRGMGGGGKEGY